MLNLRKLDPNTAKKLRAAMNEMLRIGRRLSSPRDWELGSRLDDSRRFDQLLIAFAKSTGLPPRQVKAYVLSKVDPMHEDFSPSDGEPTPKDWAMFEGIADRERIPGTHRTRRP